MEYLSDKIEKSEIERLALSGVNVVNGLEGRFNTTSKNIWVKLEETRPDFLRLSMQYKSSMIIYIAELTKRAYLDKAIYDKLLYDLFVLREKRFLASSKPQSYYYQGGKGFVFVDPQRKKNISDKDIITCAFKAIFGNGLPGYYVDFDSCNFITKELYVSLKRAEEICLLRLMEVFVERGYSYSLVLETLDKCHSALDKEVNIIGEENFGEKMKEFYLSVASRENSKEKGPNLHFTKEE